MYVHCSTSGSGCVVLRRRDGGAGSSFSDALAVLRLRGLGGVVSPDPVAAAGLRVLGVVGGFSSSDCVDVLALRLLGVVLGVSSA